MSGIDLTSPHAVAALAFAAVVVLAIVALVLSTPVYKHVICLKYLFGGWKAVVPMVAALPAALGVFLLILVFAIMDGFVRETQEMTRGTLADVIIDAHMEGLPYYDEFIRRIETIEEVEAATPVMQTYGIVRIKPRRQDHQAIEALIKPIVRPCMVIGIRPEEKSEMGRFRDYLERQRGPAYAAGSLLVPAADWPRPARDRPGCIAGVGLIGVPLTDYTVETVEAGAGTRVLLGALAGAAAVAGGLAWMGSRRRPGRTAWAVLAAVFFLAAVGLAAAAVLWPVTPAEVLRPTVRDVPLIDYGADLVVSTIPIRPSGALETDPGGVPRVSTRAFTLVDTFKSKYWEADSSHVYIDFAVAQQMAGMDAQPAAADRPAVPARASQVHVRLRDPSKGEQAVQKIRDAWAEFFRERPEVGVMNLSVNTWQTQQRMILTVVQVERNITALMLGVMFLGFGVLIALISYVMAYIKSRDVGILKAVGARDAGVGSLFLGYGFVVGLIGTALGLVAALLMLHYLDAVEIWVNTTLGIDVFPREMYYFDHIPKNVSAGWCAGVSVAVLALATLASTAGGLLAALKQPVETLRYE